MLDDDMAAEVRDIEVRGPAQGVGFRPFVYRLATALGVRGTIPQPHDPVVER